MTTDVLKNHKVNHVALVMDKSGSMRQHESTVIRVVDEFVKGLKEESDNLGHETRISLYAFDHNVECLVWDMDVKALPSMKGVYQVVGGATSLIEATVKSLEDLKSEVSQKYGEHSFLQIVVTDGEENASGCSVTGQMHTSPDGRRVNRRAQLNEWLGKIQEEMADLKDNWTSAILVPNSLAKRTAQNYGFSSGNIAIWDADTTKGVEEAIGTVTAAATSFLRGRDAGVRGTKNLFAVGQDISTADVKATLKPLDTGSYILIPVDQESPIREFVIRARNEYKTGCAFYELSKREKIQANKQIAVAEKDPKTGRTTGKVFTGPQARQLLGLPDTEVSVKPGHNENYVIYVQSTSVNRKLKLGTKLLVMV